MRVPINHRRRLVPSDTSDFHAVEHAAFEQSRGGFVATMTNAVSYALAANHERRTSRLSQQGGFRATCPDTH